MFLTKYKIFYIYFLNVIILYGNNDDPTLILNGLRSFREQLPASRILIRVNTITPFVNNECYIEILYDKGLYSFNQTNKTEVSKIIYNGTDIFHLMSGTIFIRNITQSTAFYFFDPRTIGISPLLWGQTLNGCIPLNKDNVVISFIGKENLEDKMLHHIRITLNNKYEFDYWIDINDYYKIYRYEESLSNVFKRVVISKYKDGDKWHPSNCEIFSINSKSNMLSKTIVDILKCEHSIKLNPDFWTIAGLNAPKGAPVIDLNTKNIGSLGWTTTCSYTEQHSKSQPKVPNTLLLAFMTIVFIAPLVVIWLKIISNANK